MNLQDYVSVTAGPTERELPLPHINKVWSVISIYQIKEILCVTCLSRDRTLYRVKDLATLFYFHFNMQLNAEDKICWECKFLVHKMVQFKERAAQAAGILTNFINSENATTVGTINSLSRLCKTRTLAVDCIPSSIPETHSPSTTNQASCSMATMPIVDPLINSPQDNLRPEEEDKMPATEILKTLLQSTKKAAWKPQNTAGTQKPHTITTADKENPHNVTTGIQESLTKSTTSQGEQSYANANQIRSHISTTTYQERPYTRTTANQDKHSIVCPIKQESQNSTTTNQDSHTSTTTNQEIPHDSTTVKLEFDTVKLKLEEVMIKEECSDFGDVDSFDEEVTSDNDVMTDTDYEYSDIIKMTNEKQRIEVVKDDIRIKQDDETIVLCHSKEIDEKQMEKLRSKRKSLGSFKKSKYKCETCVEVFPTEHQKYLHYMKRHERNSNLTCRVCEQKFYFEEDLEYHLQTHLRCYICYACSFSTDGLKRILNHHQTMHDVKQKICQTCGEEFSTLKMYKKHKRTHWESEKSIECEHCKRVFKNRNSLKIHHCIIHEPLPLLECDVCHKKFPGEKKLHAHKRVVHTREPVEDAYCAECDIQFKHTSTYRSHLKTSLKHTSKANYKKKCPQCDKTFLSDCYVKYHVQAVHGDEANCICNVCNKAFKTDRNLRSHIRGLHEGKKRPKKHVCQICSRAFRSNTTLKQHTNIHTGARPISCKQCDATFNNSGALYTHNKLVHLKKRRVKPRDVKSVLAT